MPSAQFLYHSTLLYSTMLYQHTINGSVHNDLFDFSAEKAEEVEKLTAQVAKIEENIKGNWTQNNIYNV